MVAMVILVTGGAGFIGSFVVDALVDLGHEVRVVDALHPSAHAGIPSTVNPDADYRWGDLADLDVARDAVSGVGAVCHQASMVGLGVDFGDVRNYVHHNDLATASLLQALHETGYRSRVVLASSMVVYGEGGYVCTVHGPVRPEPRRVQALERGEFEPECPRCARAVEAIAITESDVLDPRNVYAATKVQQEYLCSSWAREHDATVIALRYHNVYGPRMPRDTPYAGVAAIFRSSLENGNAPQVFEDGAQRRDFIHVHDIARANVMALTAPAEISGAFNIATGTPHTVGEMAAALARATPRGPGQATIEPAVTGAFRIGDVRHVFASPAAAKKALGFVARMGFEEGMADFANAPLRDRSGRDGLGQAY